MLWFVSLSVDDNFILMCSTRCADNTYFSKTCCLDIFWNHFFRLRPIQQFITLIDKSFAPDVFYGAEDYFLIIFQHRQFSSKFHRKSTTLEHTLQITYVLLEYVYRKKSALEQLKMIRQSFSYPLPSLNQKQKALLLILSASVIISCMILRGKYLIWSIPFCVLKVLNVRCSLVGSEKRVILQIYYH